MKAALNLVEKGIVPKPLLRHGIRRLLKDRLREQEEIFGPDRGQALRSWVDVMRDAPVALVPEKANEQHYELPPEFFQLTLGPRLKYSSGYYPRGDESLAEAEEEMLALTARRAGLRDGQDVLELGCGWGSLTLWMGEHFPGSRIRAVSNSAPQREHILDQARRRGIENVEVITCDMNDFDASDHFAGSFDRIVSVEMFEHMRNWEELLRRASGWLHADGRLFLHFFAHRDYAYPFEVRDESDWMSRWFFSGGMMPCYDLVDQLDSPLVTDQRWHVSGRHYARTSEQWLEELEEHRDEVLALFRTTFGAGEETKWYQRWRLFFLSCAELFGYRGGQEWIVCHTLLKPRRSEGSRS